MVSVPPPILLIGSCIALSSFIIIYGIARSSIKRSRYAEETQQNLQEQTGVEIPRDEIEKEVKKVIKGETRDIEEEIKKRAEVKSEERVKKATRGLHKSKGQEIILEYEGYRMGDSNVSLGKLHSLDRLSLNNQHGYYVLYYFPIHDSIFLNGIQSMIKVFGRGKKRLEIPEEMIKSIGAKKVLLRVKTLQSIDDKTFKAVPPESLEPAIDFNYFLRQANRTYKDLVTELMRTSNRFVKMGIMANPYHQNYASQQRMMQGQFPEDLESDFFAMEGKQLKEDRIKRAHKKLKNMDSRVEGGEEYT